MPLREFITRGVLPHWYVPGAAHFVTYRLAGTLPIDIMQSLRAKKRNLLRRPLAAAETRAQQRARVHKLLFADYDHYLDHEARIDWLRRPGVAAMVRRNLYHHRGAKYHLLAYCIMPNHVHVLLIPIEKTADAGSVGYVTDTASVGVTDAGSVGVTDAGETDDDSIEQADNRSPLSSIMHSLKSYTANQANELLGRSGPFWQKESYDHWVRDDDELERIVLYINANPVKAGLVGAPHEWFFSSAHDRFLYDGDTSGFLGDIALP